MSFISNIFSSSLARESNERLIHPYTYTIQPPQIKAGRVYHFVTDSKVEYEVRFGKLKEALGSVVNFNVLNDEYDDNEYAITNKGEQYRVVATVAEIMHAYISENPLIRTYEFSGEHKPENKHRLTSIRTRFFYRTLLRVFAPTWKIKLAGNKVIMMR